MTKTVQKGKGKTERVTEYVRNVDKRKKFVKAFGRERFLELAKVDPKYRKLLPVRVPVGYRWLWNHFQRIWRDSECDMNGYPIITPSTVLSYMEYYAVDFDIVQRNLIMRMRAWAVEVISELRKKGKS